ncbi:MAG: TIGR04076 family protein [Candidatus Hodarchaeota archaeon]
MTSYRISVVKVFEPKDVIGKDFIRESGDTIEKCGFIEENQVFMVDEMFTVLKGFCPHAWYGIFKELWMLRNCGGYLDWTGKNTVYATCPDGIRPVCFKLEKLDS